MKKIIIFFLVLFHLSAFSAYIENVPQTIKQPDGTILQCYATGDEFYNWLHDENNYTIVQDKNTGFYVYADLVGGKLVPTSYIAGKSNPKLIGITKGVNITGNEMEIKRKASILNTELSKKTKISNNKTASIGLINNIVVFIRFNDDTEFNEPISKYNELLNGSSANPNSLKNYFKECSYNKLTVESSFYLKENNFVLSYQNSYPRNYYAVYDANTNPNGYVDENDRATREQLLLKNAIDFIATQVPQNLDIDNDNDGYVDNVSFIIKGSPMGWSELLWPHRWSLSYEQAYINGSQVWDYNFLLQNSIQTGVLCHEMFHSLGSPDLYHYSQDQLKTVGSWDIMESTNNPPQSMGAYMKFQYGRWLDSIPTISTSGTYTLSPITSATNNCYKIASTNYPNEFFVLEYRKKQGYFETGLPGSGLLIYRITTIDSQGNMLIGNASGPPDEVYLYRPNGNTTTSGNIQDAFFSADVQRTKFNNNTNPYCFLLDESFGGIDIYNITEASSTISFNVNIGTKPKASFSASATSTTRNTPISFFDESLGNPSSWKWEFVGGNPANSTILNPVVSYPNYGTYQVKLKVTNSLGSDSIVKSSYIKISQLSVETGVDKTIVCGSTYKMNPHTYYFADSNSLTYQWSPAVGLSNAAIKNPIAAPSITTTYQLHVTDGTYHAYDTIVINSVPLIISSNSSNASIECGDSLFISLSTNIPTGDFIRLNSPTIDKYIVGLASFGPTLIQSFVRGDVVYINDNDNSSLGCASYATNSLLNKIAIIDRGTCSFSVKAYNAQVAGAKGVVVVNNNPNENVFQMGAGAYNDQITIPTAMITYEDGLTLKSLVQNNITNVVFGYDCDTVFYNWSPLSSVFKNNVINNVVFPQTTTTYTVSVGNNNCIESSQFTITVNKKVPLITRSNDTLFSDIAFGNQWYDTNGLIQNANNSFFVPTANGIYYCNASEPNTCISDTSNKYNFVFTSINKQNFDLVKIFPNPVNKSFLSFSSTNTIENIFLYDSNGKEVANYQSINCNNKTLDISKFNEGVYLAVIRSKNFTIYKKIVVLP
ncbi:MAG: M6 family metalloprotease domain-containing protein [Bacteroidota bacterium]